MLMPLYFCPLDDHLYRCQIKSQYFSDTVLRVSLLVRLNDFFVLLSCLFCLLKHSLLVDPCQAVHLYWVLLPVMRRFLSSCSCVVSTGWVKKASMASLLYL